MQVRLTTNHTKGKQVETMAVDKASGSSDLVSRIRGGDRQAETELVERYNRVVMNIIRRGVGGTRWLRMIYIRKTFCIVLEKVERRYSRAGENSLGSFAVWPKKTGH